MLKKSIAVLAMLSVVGSSLTACNNNQTLETLPAAQQVQQDDQINAQSLKGIWTEVTKQSKQTFGLIDADGDRRITPKEFKLETPDHYKAFEVIDQNDDGVITLKEYMPGFLGKIALTFRIRRTARSLHELLDKNKDKAVSLGELNSGLVSPSFATKFAQYDTEKGGKLFNRKTKLGLTKSEFENLYANLAMSEVPGAK